VFFGRILHCFTPAINLGHISESPEACFSILDQEIAVCDLNLSHVHVLVVELSEAPSRVAVISNCIKRLPVVQL
jgi:hypothetical protein